MTTTHPMAAVGIVVAVSVATLATGAAAQAHAFLASATPAVGSTVATAPPEVVIHFTEDVEPAFSTVVVLDGAGRTVSTGAPHLAGSAAVLAVAVGTLPPGTYTVQWHATAVDTHRTQGRFRFTVR